MIYLGADHAGFILKEEAKRILQEAGYQYEDLGNFELDKQDDYPDFALAVVNKMESNDKGILICGSGAGMCITANKIKGIRAVNCVDEFMAQQSRQHNNANVLCLGGQIVDPEKAEKIIKIWLITEFSQEERHIRRINKIKEIEE